MSPNAFINKPKPPTQSELATALGPAKDPWDRLLADLNLEYGAGVNEWNSYSLKAGWSLRVKRKVRTIVWLAPCPGCFRVAFILGEKAVRAARGIKLHQRVIKALDEAPKYPKGTAVRLEVRSSRDIGLLKKLAAIKLAN